MEERTGSGDERPNLLSVYLDLGITANMGEGIDSHFAECQLNVVRMGRVIYAPISLTLFLLLLDRSKRTFQAMQSSPKKSQSFVKIILIPISAISSPLLNSLSELPPDQSSTGLDTAVLGGDVRFHSSALIDRELFAFIDGAAKTRIVLPGVFVIGIVLQRNGSR